MKIGRNDPCPCGSGKRYKKCCLPKKSDRPEALEYRRLSKVHDALISKLIDHALAVFDGRAGALALTEFVGWPEANEAPDEQALDRFQNLFVPWFLFNWQYDRLEDEEGDEAGLPEGRTIAELYLEAAGTEADPDEARLIRAANRVPYSFFEVTAVDPGRTVGLRDVLSGREVTVQEHLGSLMLEAGGILFGRVVEVGGAGMFLGLGADVLPPDVKPELIELRRFMASSSGPISDPILSEWGVQIRRTFVDIDRRLHAPPQIRNTDGERLELHKLVYEIDAPGEAVEKLAPLCETATPDEIRAEAETDAHGEIVSAAIEWTRKGNRKSRALDNTVLGTIEIEGRRMTVAVNSAERARQIRREVERRMGGAARFRLDEVQDLDALRELEGRAEEDPSSQRERMQHPEVREQLARMLADHWEGWVDQRLPALGGRTPRQAARTADGREALEALLLSAERVSRADPSRWPLEREMLADLRRRLRLDRPRPNKAGRARAEKLDSRTAEVKALVQRFGAERLHDSYTGYALRLCDAVAASDELNLHRGRLEIWAAAVVYAVARLNFLFSDEIENHLSAAELCAWFGVKKQTAANKAARIADALELFHDDRRFCGPHVTEILHLVEDTEGFVHPAAPPGERPPPPPLKPSAWGQRQKKQVKHPPPETESAPGKKDSRQLSLFDD